MLRKEAHYDNSVRTNKVQEALMTADTVEYRYDETAGIWLPSKLVEQPYCAVPLGEDRRPTLIRETTIRETTVEVTGYSFQKPPPDTFTLARFLPGGARLRDNRKGRGQRGAV